MRIPGGGRISACRGERSAEECQAVSEGMQEKVRGKSGKYIARERDDKRVRAEIQKKDTDYSSSLICVCEIFDI